jgi:hypothetical protein
MLTTSHLRLTRIFNGLGILECKDRAWALFDMLDLVYRQHQTLIGEHTDGIGARR